MSNARTSHVAGFGLCNPFNSRTPTPSTSGATTILSGSSIHCSTSTSSDRETSSGASKSVTEIATTHERPALSEIVDGHDYLARTNVLIERIAQASNQAAVLALLKTCANTLGAENAVFVSFVRDNADVSACRFLLACSPGWCQRYLDEDCIAHDPWLAYASHHSEPIVSSRLHAVDLEAQRVMALASQNGFASAVLVPAHSGAGHSRISLLCLGSSQAGFFEGDGFGRFRLGARLLAAELHDWWTARIRRELIVKARITPSDLELLRQEHRGHSSKRIALKLQVSESSINSRFQRINVKLGVANRRMAARLVAECGILD